MSMTICVNEAQMTVNGEDHIEMNTATYIDAQSSSSHSHGHVNITGHVGYDQNINNDINNASESPYFESTQER